MHSGVCRSTPSSRMNFSRCSDVLPRLRVALAYASLPGMTIRICHEFKRHQISHGSEPDYKPSCQIGAPEKDKSKCETNQSHEEKMPHTPQRTTLLAFASTSGGI